MKTLIEMIELRKLELEIERKRNELEVSQAKVRQDARIEQAAKAFKVWFHEQYGHSFAPLILFIYEDEDAWHKLRYTACFYGPEHRREIKFNRTFSVEEGKALVEQGHGERDWTITDPHDRYDFVASFVDAAIRLLDAEAPAIAEGAA